MGNGIIYHLFCTATGKAYVGQTWGTVDQRWYAHCNEKHCVKLYRAIKKYGKERFVRSQLTGGLMTQEDMNAAEAYWIKYFDSQRGGYNIRSGGSNGRHSKETKMKMSAAARGRVKTPEHRAKIGLAFLGRKLSAEHRAKISEGGLGRIFSDKTRIKIARSLGGKPFVDQNGTRYETLAECARTLHLNDGHISAVLRGHRKQTGGYSFTYENVETPCEI